jgi:hypothetical protein
MINVGGEKRRAKRQGRTCWRTSMVNVNYLPGLSCLELPFICLFAPSTIDISVFHDDPLDIENPSAIAT